MDFVHKKGLVRSITFDERKHDHGEKQFVKLSKKAQTFVGETKNRSRSGSVSTADDGLPYSDIIYRRYFNMEGDTTKLIPPINQNKTILGEVALPAEQGPRAVSEKDAVIVVDTFSTGALLANSLYHLGYKIICVLSGDLKDLLNMIPDGLDVKFHDTLVLNTNAEEELAINTLINQINSLDLNVLAVFAGAETGVELADALSEKMKLRSNGTALSEARRNKYVMGETVRAAGIRAVKQLRASTWSEIESWLLEWNPDPFKVIVKPMDSAGSDDVTLCNNLAQVQAAFGNIMGKVNGLGIVNNFVLVQEYLEGYEYIIDMVSKDGVHKLSGIWRYDRRAANGAGFVCFGQTLLSIDDEHCREMVEYQKKVITALGILHGPTHGEVKWCRGEPVLVEVGARCQGGDGMAIKVSEECFGFSQVGATIYSYLDEKRFEDLPFYPTNENRLAFGMIKWLVNSKEGIFNGLRDVDVKEIKAKSSYRSHQVFFAAGKKASKTQNCFTWGGCVVLVNKSLVQLQADYDRIEQLESSTLFEVQPIVQLEVKKTLVAVVDPFSTGAVVAADLYKEGYGVVAVYSAKLEQLANLQSLIPAGLTLAFENVVGFDDDIDRMVTTLKELHVVAVLAGTETGVELADALSEKMKLRNNGTALSEARRNKYVMGETVRAAGIRAVKQLRASTWSEIESWLLEWNPDPFKVIVKPMDSAGSDGVTLCHNAEEVCSAFNKTVGKVNGLGIVNRSVLVQEYLEGQEYVIDMVSKDGIHKAVALWAYDRRAANGAGFVCFGQTLLSIDDEHCREMVEYQKKVITALGILHGPTHGEVKWYRGEPVLVEVGARCHGAEGMWQVVADQVYGYNQVQSSIDAYLHPERFDALPDVPSVKHVEGRMLFLIVPADGYFVELDPTMLEEIQNMPSFVKLDVFLKSNTVIKKTIDCFGFGGVVRLVNKSAEQLLADYERIREMETTGLFIFRQEE